MTSSTDLGPIPQQYAAAATVPLIKSPSLWLPKPVELPNDIHPLPEDITAYFVYPFTLETHVISLNPQPHVAIAQQRARNAALLHQREVEEERRERDALHKIAPGYNPSSLLVPMSSTPLTPQPPALATSSISPSQPKNQAAPTTSTAKVVSGMGSDMDELVQQLEEMESRH